MAPLEYSSDTISASRFRIMPNMTYHLTDTIDLHGKTLILPQNVTLVSKKGGLIRNGHLKGNGTRINGKATLFDYVKISGTWIVPIIRTSLFAHLDYDNSLKDVIALSNPLVKNKIIIDRGEYHVSAVNNGDVILVLNNNTEMILYGKIRLTPNTYPSYSILGLFGNNIRIHGKGSVYGDKQSHLGKDGEWGMGIYVTGGNVSIKDVSVSGCWGDCIYVRTRSDKILIENCNLSDGRRQGISITSARDVTIKKCMISNVSGTLPEYAIDVEPNKDEIVDNVIIKNVTVEKCRGGFLVYGKASGARVGKVSINGCKLIDIPKMPISFQKCDSGVVDNCIFKNCKHKELIGQEGVKNMVRKKIKVE